MLTDAEVALLRDIGLASGLNEDNAALLALVARGYLEKDGDLFKLTAMGLRALMEKGAS